MALWAVASVLVYRRVRRLLPFILVHALWDVQAGTSDFVSDDAYGWLLGGFFVGLYLVSTWPLPGQAPRPAAAPRPRPSLALARTAFARFIDGAERLPHAAATHSPSGQCAAR